MRERENILVAEMSDGVYRCVCFGAFHKKWRSIYCNPMLVNIFFFTSLVG